MTFGSAPPPADPVSHPRRTLEPAEWAATGIPLLSSPRATVTDLWERHRPQAHTAVVGVLGPDGRLVASASFSHHRPHPDGWDFRNALLARLRRVIPHDLRLRTPVRTAVLLVCRDGEPRWTDLDGAWMWGLRDACTLHGLRCGAYVALTPSGWQVLGEGRGGRRPYAGSLQDGSRAGRRCAAGRRTPAAVPRPSPAPPAAPERPARRCRR